MDKIFHCNTCPRRCGAIRQKESGNGFCGAPVNFRIARSALHFWEEPCLSGTGGSGAIFFCGCVLRCVYCQNEQISRNANTGKAVSELRLIELMKQLEQQGAQTINLVNPTHYALQIASALRKYKPQVPVVYNTGSYDDPHTLDLLKDVVDVFLADMKYVDSVLSKKYSGVADYFSVAQKAILKMCEITGPIEYDGNGIAKKGTIIRHLVLPGCTADSVRVLRWYKDNIPKGTPFSLMAQYTPNAEVQNYPELNRKLYKWEYEKVLRYLERWEIDEGWIQSLDSANESYIPAFDFTGV